MSIRKRWARFNCASRQHQYAPVSYSSFELPMFSENNAPLGWRIVRDANDKPTRWEGPRFCRNCEVFFVSQGVLDIIRWSWEVKDLQWRIAHRETDL